VAIPANVFGPGDDFSEENSHVVGALIRRMHEAKVGQRRRVEIWGSGSPRREFIYSADLADACLFIMKCCEGKEPLNVGVGMDWSVRELADLIKEIVGYCGELVFDRSKADGMPVKLLDSTPLQKMGWQPRTPIKEGLAKTYQWFLREGERVELGRQVRASL
jgi:GDP-L-fucose synthase